MIRPWFKRRTGKYTLAQVLPLIERKFATDYWLMPLGNWAIIVAHGKKQPEHNDGDAV
jgi:hypothetical protein